MNNKIDFQNKLISLNVHNVYFPFEKLLFLKAGNLLSRHFHGSRLLLFSRIRMAETIIKVYLYVAIA